MIPELSTHAQQLTETFHLFQKAITEIPETDLDRTFGGKTRSVVAITAHVLEGQIRYNQVVEKGVADSVITPAPFESISHAALFDALEKSLAESLAVLERVPATAIDQPLAKKWGVWNDGSTETPLDVRWFAAQMVRHAAYHSAQIFVYSLMLEQP